MVVRSLKAVFAFFSDHRLLGIPSDLILRFFILGCAYLAFRERLGRKRCALVCIVVLVCKELFDVVAVQNLLHPRWPDWGDVADILSGLLGIACAEAVAQIRRWVRWRRSGDCP